MKGKIAMDYKRTKLKPEEPAEHIERKILINMITNNDYMKEIMKIDNPVQYLESQTARMLGSWCSEHYKKYGSVIGKEMQDLYYVKLKELNINKDIADDIEEILDGLSDESITEPPSKFLLEQTIKHFQRRQAVMFNEASEMAVSNNEIDEFNKLRETFKPIIEINTEPQLKLSEMYDKKYEPVKWLIEELLPKGLTVFAGKSKTGKSYLMLNIMLKLAQNDWLFADDSSTGFHGERGNILYLALEDTESRLAGRMKNIDPNPKTRALDRYLDLKLTWPKFYTGGLIKIEQWLQEKTNPILVVIDVIERIAPKSAKTGAGRYYTEEYGILGPIADLAHKYDNPRHSHLAGQQYVLTRLRHRAVRCTHHQNCSVHLRSTRDHVLHVVRMTRTVNMRIVTLI